MLQSDRSGSNNIKDLRKNKLFVDILTKSVRYAFINGRYIFYSREAKELIALTPIGRLVMF